MYSRGWSFLCAVGGAFTLELPGLSQTVGSGGLALVPPDMYGELAAPGRMKLLSVRFDHRFVRDCLGTEAGRLAPGVIEAAAPLYAELIGIAVLALGDRAMNRLRLNAALYGFMDLLRRRALPPRPAPAEKPAFEERLSALLAARFSGPLTLSGAAAALSYTPQHLAARIKAETGLTFMQYLRKYRLDEAARLLRLTDAAEAEIAAGCGFPSAGALADAFRAEYGRPPADYRQARLSEAERIAREARVSRDPEAVSFLMSRLPPMEQAELGGTGRRIERALTADAPRAVPPIWRELLSLGSAAELDHAGYMEALAEAQAELHFRYGRVGGLLSRLAEYPGVGCDFGALFELLDAFAALNLLPWIVLDGGEPTRRLLPLCLHSCLRRYGAEALGRWRFELRPADGETAADYRERFSDIGDLLRAVLPQAQLGGPDLDACAPAAENAALLEALFSARRAPDFITAHLFDVPVPSDGGTPVCEPVAALRQAMRGAKPDVPLYVTRFGASEGNLPAADSSCQGSLILRQTAACLGVVSGMGYAALTDLTLVKSGAAAPFFGGGGLLSRDGLKKPAYHACAFLSALGTRLVGRGAHHIVTADGEGGYQALLFHYDYPQPGDAAADGEPVELRLTLERMPPGRYRLVTRRVDRRNGNAPALLAPLVPGGAPERAELEYVRHASAPLFTVAVCEVQDALTLSATLGRGDFVLITATPQR